jgi:hypothetical protein
MCSTWHIYTARVINLNRLIRLCGCTSVRFIFWPRTLLLWRCEKWYFRLIFFRSCLFGRHFVVIRQFLCPGLMAHYFWWWWVISVLLVTIGNSIWLQYIVYVSFSHNILISTWHIYTARVINLNRLIRLCGCTSVRFIFWPRTLLLWRCEKWYFRYIVYVSFIIFQWWWRIGRWRWYRRWK